MDPHSFVLATCILTVLAHISLMFMRGYLIGQLWKAFRKMQAKNDLFIQEQEKWREDFEERHPSWMTSKKRRAS